LQAELGIQAHCLRHRIAANFEATLAEVAALGVTALELVYFPGCRGNAWGDFGAATDLPPAEIGAAIRALGLCCPSVMVNETDLHAERAGSTLDWIVAVGCPRVVLTSLSHSAAPSLEEWTHCFERMRGAARQCRSRGLEFALHTQPDLWAEVAGVRPADELLRQWDDSFRIEFDPSGAIIYGTDPAAYIRQRPEAFYALHLRDGDTPPAPVFYLAASALGAGSVDWRDVLAAADASAIEWGILEMEVPEPADVLPALRASLDYLHRHGHREARR
jgi:sugar phosphate isomerase/epimerase